MWERGNTQRWTAPARWSALALQRVRSTLHRPRPPCIHQSWFPGRRDRPRRAPLRPLSAELCRRGEWLAERGVAVDRSTVYRWVQRFLPRFEMAARTYRQAVGGKWRVDETYCRVHGSVGVLVSRHRGGCVLLSTAECCRCTHLFLSMRSLQLASGRSVSQQIRPSATRRHFGRSCPRLSIVALNI